MNIIELELLSDNLPETEKFYKTVLGISPFFSEKDALFFLIGQTKLIFRKSENLNPVYHFAIDVPNNRLMDACNHIRRQVQIIPLENGTIIADFTAWDAKSFYFFDNNGNIVECITRYPNATDTPELFGSNSYLSVSEIGLVSNNVPELADTLASEFGITVYKRQPRSETFTVSGDDQGLFILSAKGRDWYPTKVKSRSFRTRVLFLDNGNIGHIVR